MIFFALKPSVMYMFILYAWQIDIFYMNEPSALTDGLSVAALAPSSGDN